MPRNVNVVIPGPLGLPSLENLVLNPRAEGGSGTSEIWRNLVHNPSSEHGPTGTTVVKTNWFPNPGMKGATPGVHLSSIGGNPAPLNTSVDTVNFYNGTQSVKFTITGDGQFGRTMITNPTGLVMNPGDTLHWSYWIYSSRAGTISPYWEGSTFGTGTYAGGGGGASTTFAANTWTKVVGFYTRPTTAPAIVNIRPGAYAFNVQAGDTINIDAGMVEKNVRQGNISDYFDGDTPDENGWDYSWVGAANASASVARTLTSTVSSNMVMNPSFETAGATVTQTVNRVANPSFETGVSRWTWADVIFGAPSHKTTLDWQSHNIAGVAEATMTGGWGNRGGTSTMSHSSSEVSGLPGSSVLKVVEDGTTGMSVRVTSLTYKAVTPGEIIGGSVAHRAAATPRNMTLYLEWFTSAGAYIGAAAGAGKTSTTTDWTTVTAIGQAPPNAAYVTAMVVWSDSAGTETHYLSQFGLFRLTPSWTNGGTGGNLLNSATAYPATGHNWTGENATVSVPTTGTLRITSSNVAQAAAHNSSAKVPVIGGQPIFLRATYLGSNSEADTGGLTFKGRWYDSAGVQIGSTVVPGSSTTGSEFTWMPTAPSNAASFLFMPTITNSGANVTGDYIDVSFLGAYQLSVPAWVPPTGATGATAFASGTAAGLFRGGARHALTSLQPGAAYASSIFIFPTVGGQYSLSMPTTPTPLTESGPGRKYAQVKNGAGAVVEEATANLARNGDVLSASDWSGVESGSPVYDPSFSFTGRGGSMKITSTIASQNARAFRQGFSGNPLTTYTSQVRVFVPERTTITHAYLQAEMGGTNGGTLSGPPTLLVPGQWNFVTQTWTTAETVGYYQAWGGSMLVNVVLQGTQVGSEAWIDAFQIEKKAYPTTFTDGGMGTGYSYTTTTNLVSNPNFETNTAGWEGINKNLLTADQSSFETGTGGWFSAANAALSRSTSVFYAGAASLNVSALASGDVQAGAVQNEGTTLRVVPGQVYTFVAMVRAASTSRQVFARIRWNDSAGVPVGPGIVDGLRVYDYNSGWVQVQITVVAPAGAYAAVPRVVIATAAAGETHFVDAASFMHTPQGNLIPNPGFASGTTGFLPDTGSPTISASTETSHIGRWSTKATNSSVTTDLAVRHSSVWVGVGTHTYSIYVKPSYNATLRLDIANGSGSTLAGTVTSPTVSAPANVWTRVSGTFTSANDGTVHVYIHALGTVNAASTVYYDSVQLVQGSSALTYIPPETNNLVINPSVETNLNDIQGYYAPTYSRDTVEKYSGAAAIKVVTSGSANPEGVIYRSIARCVGTTPGQITASVFVKAPAGQRLTIKIRGLANPDSFTSVADNVAQTTYTATGGWDRLTTTNTTGLAGVWYAGVSVHTEAAVPAGVTYWVDAAQIEYGSTATAYVDGSLGAGFTWDTSDNMLPAETSSFEGGTDGGWTNSVNTSGHTVVTDQFFSGTRSFRWTAGSAGSSRVRMQGATGVPGSALSIAPGTYTFSIYFRSGTVARTAWLALFTWDSAGTLVRSTESISLAVATSTTAWTRLVGTFTIDPGDAYYSIGVTADSALAGEQFYIDAAQLEARDYATPFNNAGTANATTSTRRLPWVLGGTTLERLSLASWFKTTGTYSMFIDDFQQGMRGMGAHGIPAGAQTTVAVNSPGTYTLSYYSYGGVTAEVINPNNFAVLASKVGGSGDLQRRDFMQFTTPAGVTNVILRWTRPVAFDLYLDNVQLESGTDVTPFGVGVHGGVNGYPSYRAMGQLGYSITPMSMQAMSVVATIKVKHNSSGQIIDLNNMDSNPDTLRIRHQSGVAFFEIFGNGAPNSFTVPITFAVNDTLTVGATYDGVTMRGWAKVNNGATVTGSSNMTKVFQANADRVYIGANPFNSGNHTNAPTENVMVFNTTLSTTDMAALVDGTTIPSTAASRADCVFSAFVNDPPTSIVPLTAGSWQRVVNIETQDKNTQADLVVLGPDGAQFYLDAAQVELGLTATDYFDGSTPASGDYTFAWSGTAHDSSPLRQAAIPANTSVQVSGTSGGQTYLSGVRARTGTKSVRVSRGVTYNFINHNIGGLAGSTTYTVKFWVYSNQPDFSFVDRGTGSGTYVHVNMTTTPGTWTEQKRTFTTGATESNRVFSIGYESGRSVDGAEIYIDDIIVSQADFPYFSGDTAGDGDFVYVWNGTAHASTSSLVVPQVSYFQGGGGGSSVRFRARKPGGGYRLGIVGLGFGPDNNTKGDSHATLGGDTGLMRTGMLAGRSYTVSATWHQGATTGIRTQSTLNAFTRVGAASYVVSSSSNLVNGQRTTLTFTIPSGATEAFVRLPHGYTNAGDVVYYDDIVLTEGKHDGTYFDGNIVPPVRTNLVAVPSLEESSSGWGSASAGGSVSTARHGSAARTGLWGFRVLWNSDATSSTGGGNVRVYSIVPGQAYTGSIYVRPSVTTEIRPRFTWRSGDTVLSGDVNGQSIICPANEWTRVSVTGQAPAGADNVYLTAYRVSGMWKAGDFVHYDDALIENFAFLSPYYEKTTPADDFTYAWTGTPHNSASIISAPRITGVNEATGNLQPSRLYKRTVPDLAGFAKSFALFAPSPTTNASYRLFLIDFDTDKLKSGKTYTLAFWNRITGHANYTGGLSVQRSNAQGRVSPSSTVEWTPAWTRTVFTFVATGDAADSGVDIYISLPSAANHSAFTAEVTGVVLYEGVDAGYFDGNSGTDWSWSGAPHASTSVRQNRQLEPIISNSFNTSLVPQQVNVNVPSAEPALYSVQAVL